MNFPVDIYECDLVDVLSTQELTAEADRLLVDIAEWAEDQADNWLARLAGRLVLVLDEIEERAQTRDAPTGGEAL